MHGLTGVKSDVLSNIGALLKVVEVFAVGSVAAPLEHFCLQSVSEEGRDPLTFLE